jgi:HlyD family secretion protein
MKTHRRILIYCAASIAAGGGAGLLFRVDAEHAVAPPARLGLAAPGRVEPADEERVVRAERPGILTAVEVEENDRVEAGQVLAELDRADLLAQRRAAAASVDLARAQRARLVHGARAEERREAKARLAEADANLAYSEREYTRRSALRSNQTIGAADLERAQRELEVAKARRDETAEGVAVIDGSARADDLAIADAELELAQARVAIVDAEIAKTYIRSPIAGTVLHRFAKRGEAVGMDPPPALFVLGDLSSFKVRAEIDEVDVARVHVGDRAVVTADAYPNKKFAGAVTRVGLVVGGKAIVTQLPGERQDRKVLETLIALDPGVAPPIGLRVDVFIE